MRNQPYSDRNIWWVSKLCTYDSIRICLTDTLYSVRSSYFVHIESYMWWLMLYGKLQKIFLETGHRVLPSIIKYKELNEIIIIIKYKVFYPQIDRCGFWCKEWYDGPWHVSYYYSDICMYSVRSTEYVSYNT